MLKGAARFKEDKAADAICASVFLISSFSPFRGNPDKRDNAFSCPLDLKELFLAALETFAKRVRPVEASFKAGFGV